MKGYNFTIAAVNKEGIHDGHPGVGVDVLVDVLGYIPRLTASGTRTGPVVNSRTGRIRMDAAGSMPQLGSVDTPAGWKRLPVTRSEMPSRSR